MPFRKLHNVDEITYFRRLITQYNYLSPSSTNLPSLDGKKLLDKELVNFDEKCQQNKEMWYKNYPSSTKLDKILITDENRKKYHDIENKTKREIEQMVTNTL